MKKIIPLCITALFLWGCSASSPSVTTAEVSDGTPVAGQKILLHVVSVSDNPPMTYAWDCGGIGNLEPALDVDGNPIGYYEYWTAPDDYSGPVTVTCTVTDDRDETETHVFNIEVKARELASIKNENGEEYPVSSIEKQRDTDIGGVWFSTNKGEIRYITSAADQLSTTWTGTFGTMQMGYDANNYYTLWGVPPAEGNVIFAETTEGTTTLTSPVFGAGNKINDMTVCPDVSGTAALLFGVEGPDQGIYFYGYYSGTWDRLPSYSDKTYAFFTGTYYTYAATSAGVYKLLSSDPPICTSDSCAVLEVDADDPSTTDVIETDIWHVTKDGEGNWKVWKNGAEFASQPPAPEVAGTLDVDLKGNIWCGKYSWNGSSWQTPPDPNGELVGESIKTVVASTEGRIYFLTESGALFRW